MTFGSDDSKGWSSRRVIGEMILIETSGGGGGTAAALAGVTLFHVYVR